MENGANGLRYDDCANVVSFATDSAVRGIGPIVDEEFSWNPFKVSPTQEEPLGGVRYVRW